MTTTKVERQTGEQKTARNPVKIIRITPLKKPAAKLLLDGARGFEDFPQHPR